MSSPVDKGVPSEANKRSKEWLQYAHDMHMNELLRGFELLSDVTNMLGLTREQIKKLKVVTEEALDWHDAEDRAKADDGPGDEDAPAEASDPPEPWWNR